MIEEFISQDQDIVKHANTRYLKTFVLLPFFGLWMVILIYSIIYHEGRHRRNKLDRVIEGLSYMSATSIIISILACIGVTVLFILSSRHYFRNREIVVGLKFNDQTHEVTITTKTIVGKEYVRTHKYSELVLEKNNLSDGITSIYNTLTFVKGQYLAGHIYLDHFTWDSGTLSEIRAKLSSSIR
jgi:hypothetical protein